MNDWGDFGIIKKIKYLDFKNIKSGEKKSEYHNLVSHNSLSLGVFRAAAMTGRFAESRFYLLEVAGQIGS